jgi:hypothetical protein
LSQRQTVYDSYKTVLTAPADHFMPPKASAAAAKVTVETLYEIQERMDSAESPAEADFKTILSAVKAGPDEQSLTAQLIPRYAASFPKLKSQSLSAIKDLTASADLKVRKTASAQLGKLLDFAKSEIAGILFSTLIDADPGISSLTATKVVHSLTTDDEFRQIFFIELPKQSPEVQCKMIGYVRDEMQFSEESVPQLLRLLDVAFGSSVIEGLRLYGKNKKLISDEQAAPLIDGLLTRLDNSLVSNFDDVIESLLPQLFSFTRTMGDAGTRRFLSILSERVLPNFQKIPVSLQLAVLHKISDTARFVESENVLSQVYAVFLSFPTADTVNPTINFSVIEATLWAFIKLAQAFPKVASRLIGTILVFTGQPGEYDNALENQDLRVAFTSRIEYIQSLCEAFVNSFDAEIVAAQALGAESDERRERLNRAKTGQRTGNNCRHLCRLLLSNSPLSGKLPKAPSWQKVQPDARRGGDRSQDRRGGDQRWRGGGRDRRDGPPRRRY